MLFKAYTFCIIYDTLGHPWDRVMCETVIGNTGYSVDSVLALELFGNMGLLALG